MINIMNKKDCESYNKSRKEKLRERGFKISTYDEFEKFSQNRKDVAKNRGRECSICNQTYDMTHFYLAPSQTRIDITRLGFCTSRFGSCLFCRVGILYDEEKRAMI